MFLSMLREYSALVVFSLVLFGTVQLFLLSLTAGSAIRVYIISIYTGDFVDNKIRRTKIAYTAAGFGLFLGVSVVSLSLSGGMAIALYPLLQSPLAAIFIVILPIAYLITYIAFGVVQYSRQRTILKQASWNDIIDRPAVYDIGVADASYRATTCWFLFAFIAPALWPWSKLVYAHRPASQEAMNAAGGVSLIACLVFLSSVFILAFLDKLVPHKRIINRGLVLLHNALSPEGSRPRANKMREIFCFPVPLRPRSFAPTRWRTGGHRSGYELARNLERAVLGMRRRFVKDEYDEIYCTFARVANALRRHSIATKEERTPNYISLVQCSIALLALEQPLHIQETAKYLTEDELEGYPQESRILLSLNSLNSYVQASWNTLKVVGAIATLVAISALGKWAEVGKYFLQQ